MVIGTKALKAHTEHLAAMGMEIREVPASEFVPVDFRFGHGTPTRSHKMVIIPVGLWNKAYAEFRVHVVDVEVPFLVSSVAVRLSWFVCRIGLCVVCVAQRP